MRQCRKCGKPHTKWNTANAASRIRNGTYRKLQSHHCGYPHKAVKTPIIQNIWRAAVPPQTLLTSQTHTEHATTRIQLCWREWENDRSHNTYHRRPYPGPGVRAPNVFTSISKMYPDLSGKLTCIDTATISLLGHWARSSSKASEAAAAEPAETPPSRKP